MDRLRPRERKVFTGFTTAEVEKMEKLLNGAEEKNVAFFKKLTRSFNSSSGRAGKPSLKWTEVQSWYQNRQPEPSSKDDSARCSTKLNLDNCSLDKPNETLTSNGPASLLPIVVSKSGDEERDLLKLEFEAKSSRDGAWYDVEKLITYRTLRSGEIEARVRFAGFGPNDDEWLNAKESIRERSIGLDHSECQTLKPGNLVLCFQEKNDAAKYYDAHIVDIQRKRHDARGCRCIFHIRYNHNNIEEQVELSRLYRQPRQQRRHPGDA